MRRAKMAQAIIDSSDRNPAPRRLALGSDAYALIRATLTGRIAELDAQRAIALSTDADDAQAVEVASIGSMIDA